MYAKITTVQIIIKDESIVTCVHDNVSCKWSIQGPIYPRHIKVLTGIIALVKEADKDAPKDSHPPLHSSSRKAD